MSQRLIARNPDLKRLRDEGYDVSLTGPFLVVKGVPYANAARQVLRGTIIKPLTMQGETALPPADHVVSFVGETPCKADGVSMASSLEHDPNSHDVGHGLRANRRFSNKPPEGFSNYHDLIVHYVNILSGPAEALEPTATARTFPPARDDDPAGPFVYWDTNSSRNNTAAISEKLTGNKIAIVGLGGSGAYVLDFVAKTPVAEIHLYDADIFSNHNAFRAPGAATLEDLEARQSKVAYLTKIYSAMKRGIIPHAGWISAENATELAPMDFVFVSIDNGEAKKAIVKALVAAGKPFIDLGMGLWTSDGTIGGNVRTTLVTPSKSDHVHKGRIDFSSAGDDAYATNIQVAELNALNAVMAVVAWKRHVGFYNSSDRHHFSNFTIRTGELLNEDNAFPTQAG